jgi:hypothetical protein
LTIPKFLPSPQPIFHPIYTQPVPSEKGWSLGWLIDFFIHPQPILHQIYAKFLPKNYLVEVSNDNEHGRGEKEV